MSFNVSFKLSFRVSVAVYLLACSENAHNELPSDFAYATSGVSGVSSQKVG